MADVDYSPAINVAAQIAQDAALQAKLWRREVLSAEENEDFYMQFEGPGENAIIPTINDTSKGDGSYVTFRLDAGFYASPHQGAQYFETPNDFEKLKQGTFSLQVRRVKHGTSFDSETDEYLGMMGELVSRLPRKQGNWMGRYKTEQIDMMYREQIPSTNKFIQNGQPTIDALTSADGISFNGLLQIQATASEQGGLPGVMKTDRQGNEIEGYTFIAGTNALYSLRTDSDYRDSLKTTRDEDAAKTLFAGGWVLVNGIAIKDRRIIDHDGWGPIGSAMNPKALLGNAVTASSTAITVLGGGDAIAAAIDVDYFRYFHNNPYQFQPGQVVAQDNKTHYFLVVNPSNAPVDPGKIGMYSYTTGFNNTTRGVSGLSLTTTGQLGPSTVGTQVNTMNGGNGAGGVTWNTGVWAGKHTQTHPIGATIYQCNGLGQPIGHSVFLGRASAFRGYGKDRLKRGEQYFEGGDIKQIYIKSTFGQALRIDTRQRTPAAFKLAHAINYTNTTIPQNIGT